MSVKLYDFPLSGHAHRAKLFLSLLDVDAEIIEVKLAEGEHKLPAYLKMNSFGQVPVLDDGGVIISDSNAILIYLAKKYGKDYWLPDDPERAAAVQRWLSVAAGPIAFGPAAARLITLFGAPLNAEEVIDRAHSILTIIDRELSDKPFITGDQVTIADISLYSYIANAPEGNVDISQYTNVGKWLHRIENLQGFISFPKSDVGLRKSA